MANRKMFSRLSLGILIAILKDKLFCCLIIQRKILSDYYYEAFLLKTACEQTVNFQERQKIFGLCLWKHMISKSKIVIHAKCAKVFLKFSFSEKTNNLCWTNTFFTRKT